ncbi:MAG: peptidylprolyl isomerase [Nanoarchaeota archaeon]|nr:peptidylprolyl isomerase [Nanoarchaeota archaeon]
MIKQNDFLKIDFTGTVKGGEIFDSTKKEELEQIYQDSNRKINPKPFVFCIGHKMFLESIEEYLIGKEMGKDYEIELTPEKGFGPRNPSLIQRIPQRVFRDQRLNPIPGISFNFDGKVGRVLAVSGGRIMTDFNHPLAGKDVVYKIKVLEKVDNITEKVKALNDFFFHMEPSFEIKENKLILVLPESIGGFAMLFKDKYKEILGLDLEIKRTKVKELKSSSGQKQS